MAKTLRVNPIACDGHGLCAELLPERVSLDDWGYPIVDPEPVSGELESHARRAVAACPTLALLLRSISASLSRPSRASCGAGTLVEDRLEQVERGTAPLQLRVTPNGTSRRCSSILPIPELSVGRRDSGRHGYVCTGMAENADGGSCRRGPIVARTT